MKLGLLNASLDCTTLESGGQVAYMETHPNVDTSSSMESASRWIQSLGAWVG